MPVYYKLRGFEKLLDKLHALEPVVQRKVIRQALRPGAKVMLASAKYETRRFKYRWPLPAGRQVGDLYRGMKVQAIKRTRKAIGLTALSAYKGPLYYGAFVNWGHKIGKRPGKGKPDHRAKVRPVQFMTMGFRKSHKQAEQIVRPLLREGIVREWRTLWGR